MDLRACIAYLHSFSWPLLVPLLVANPQLSYCTIRKGGSDNATTAKSFTPFPTSLRRCLYGGLVCGLATFAAYAILGDVFYSMPVDIGSLPSDLLLFGVGVVAMRSQWLTRPIEEQMDTSVWNFRVGVLLEAVALLALESIMSKGVVVSLLFYLVAGFFCLDVTSGLSTLPGIL